MRKKKLFQKPQIVIPLMIGLFGLLGGAFFIIGTQVNDDAAKEIGKLTVPATTPPSSTKFSFAKLGQSALQTEKVEPFARDISGSHGLGIFDGVLYASSWDQRKLYAINLETGERRTLADELDGLHDMIVDDEGKLVVPVFGEDRVVKIDRKSGRVEQLADGLDGPNGIARARDGGYYVSNAKSGTVVKLTPAGEEERVVAKDLREPAGILSDNDNILLVAQYGDTQNSVIQIADNGTVSTVIRGLANAESLLRDEERNVIIGHTVGGKAALSILPRGQAVRPLLSMTLAGPMVGPVTDGRYLYFESAADGQSTVYRVLLP